MKESLGKSLSENEPPEKLDEARVLCWCLLPPEEGAASGAAICQYERADGFYLFWCNEKWEVIGDTDHDSINDATDSLWQLYPDAYGELKYRVTPEQYPIAEFDD